ncbi:MAG: CrcB family protein [Limnohabitans sp.]|nr:CrcB family protein [Limnohabitans sp.]
MLAAGDIFDTAFAIDFGGAVIGAAIGSVLRDRIVHVARTKFLRADLGVLFVNLLACTVVALAVAASQRWHGLLVLGFAGGLSTWSSLAVDVAGMMRERRWERVGLHIPIAFLVAIALLLGITAFLDQLSMGVDR